MREKLKTVKNAVVHVLILLLVFIGAVVLFEKLINQSTPNSAQDMENSTFPLVYMQNKGVSYNCLHGYAYEIHSHGGKEYEGHHGKYQSIGEKPEDRDRAEIVYG